MCDSEARFERLDDGWYWECACGRFGPFADQALLLDAYEGHEEGAASE